MKRPGEHPRAFHLFYISYIISHGMISCKECGTENPDGARFCWSCGTAIDSPAAIAEAAVSEQDPVVEPLHMDVSAEEPETIPASNARTIDFGGPTSIDLGVTDEPEEQEAPRKERRHRETSERRAPGTRGDPFNAKVLVMIAGMLSLVISCYCLFGYKPELILCVDGTPITTSTISMMTVFGLNSIGTSGIVPSDVVSVAITLTIVLAAISAVRPIPVIASIMGIITTLMYYKVEIEWELSDDPLHMIIDSTSLTIMICLWIAVAALSLIQYIALKKYAASCPEEPCPLVRIWFGKL